MPALTRAQEEVYNWLLDNPGPWTRKEIEKQLGGRRRGTLRWLHRKGLIFKTRRPRPFGDNMWGVM